MATLKNITIATACLLAGCTLSPSERAWQTMHVIDVAQTLNGPASDPCYRETGLITSRLIGEQPESEAVIAWGVAWSIGHYYAWKWIDSRDWPDGLKIALRSLDLGMKGTVVLSNHLEGTRPFGENSKTCS